MSATPLLVAEALAPVRLALDTQPAPAASVPWLLVALLTAAALAAGGAVSWLAWRARAGTEEEDRVWRALARRLGLNWRARAAVLRLARREGVPPAALVLSPGLFEHAARGDPRAAALARALFADR
jgi:hypothetical protein